MDLASFEPLRVPEALLAEAYEGVTPQQRAWLKTTQALVQSVYGEKPTMNEHRCRPAGSGFAHSVHTVPVSWVLVLVGETFAAPCRLSAALMTVRLTGVENVLVFFAGAPGTICPAVFAACELAGVENLYALPQGALSPAPLTAFNALPPSDGRVLTFGTVENTLSFPAWHDAPPRVAIAPDSGLTEDALRRFHPDAVFVAPDTSPADALYSGTSTLDSCGVPLCLGPGLEGAWFPVGLLPDFFQRRTVCLVQMEKTI